MKKRARLDEKDIKFIKSSGLSNETIANIVGCSVGAVAYHKNVGIWAKRKPSKR